MDIGIIMWICGIVFIALVACIIWALMDMSARNDGEYHKCKAKVCYIYNQPRNYETCEWASEEKDRVIIHIFKTSPAPNYCKDGQTFTCEIEDITILETKGDLIWGDL